MKARPPFISCLIKTFGLLQGVNVLFAGNSTGLRVISAGKRPTNYRPRLGEYFANNLNKSGFHEVLCLPKLIHINVVSSR